MLPLASSFLLGWQKLASGQLCSKIHHTEAVTSEAQCRVAAAELGLEFGAAWAGPGDFPGCFHDPLTVKVFWNSSPSPGLTANVPRYRAICLAGNWLDRLALLEQIVSVLTLAIW